MPPKRKVDKKQMKIGRLAETISDMAEGESISPTALALKAGMKQPTLKDMIDEHDFLGSIGFKIFRDDKKEIKLIVKCQDEINLKTDIKTLRQDMIQIKSDLEKIKLGLNIK